MTDNYRQVRFVLIFTLGLNLVVTLAKLIVGFATNSLSLVAVGFDSLFDSSANVVGLVGIYIAARPPDRSHPYGHHKFETLAALSTSVLLFVTTFELVKSAIERLRTPVEPEINVWTFGAIGLSICVSLFVAVYEHRKGRELQSEVLISDALHTRADVLVSLSMLMGAILVRLGFPIADPILALIISGVIAKIGIDIIRHNTGVLADAAVLDEAEVERIVTQVEGVRSLHRVRSRGSLNDIHLDLHVRVQPGMPIEQAHHVAHQVQRQLMDTIPGVRDVVVHAEPEQAGELPEDLSAHIRAIAGRIPDTAVHSVQVLRIGQDLHIALHLEVAADLPLGRAHALADQLEDMLHQEMPGVSEVSIHIEPAGAPEAGLALTDSATVEDVREALAWAAAQVAGIEGGHDLHVVRQQDRLLLSAHWYCDPDLTVEATHALSEELERQIRKRLPAVSEVIVHLEPRRSATAQVGS